MEKGIIESIEHFPYALLITIDNELKPDARYIGPVVVLNNDIYFFTKSDSRKSSQLRNNPAVILYFQEPSQQYRGISINGIANSVNPDNCNEILQKLGLVSPGYRDYLSRDGFKKYAVYRVTCELVQDISTDFSSPPKINKSKVV